MRKYLARTLLAAAGLAVGISQTAHAGAFADAMIVGGPGHASQRDVFTEGARISSRDGYTDGSRSDARDASAPLS